MSLKCPACGADHNYLRLQANVSLDIFLDRDGATGMIDLNNWTVEDIRENIYDQHMSVKCMTCDAVFDADFSDNGFIEIKEEWPRIL